MKGGASFAAAAALVLALGWPGVAAAHDCLTLPHATADTAAACAGASALTRGGCQRAGGVWTPAASGVCGNEPADADTVRDTLVTITDEAIEWTPTLAPIYLASATLGLSFALLAAGFRRALGHLAALVGRA